MKDCDGETEEKRNADLMSSVTSAMNDLFGDNVGKKTKSVADIYIAFFKIILDLLNKSNSRETPRTANIFTTNYDLFIENALDTLLQTENFIINDGACGYFNRFLDGANYNRAVSYRGLNDNYTDELVTLNLIKPHGSINWVEVDDRIRICNTIQEDFVRVPPTGVEAEETFMNNHFHEMLRIFQWELDKPQSILLVIGFSFQDQHIAKMVRRALKNKELIICVFVYKKDGIEDIMNNLKISAAPSNLYFIIEKDIDSSQEDDLSFENLCKYLGGEEKYASE